METKGKTRHKLLAGAVGNFIEVYDFTVFGLSVPIIALYFFPGSDKTAALLSTFAVYAVAFFARPVGGLLFGYIADRAGRVKVLAATVWLMAAGTALMGLLPTYSSLGIAAPILLVIFRFAQGVALGGETTGGATFVIESASPGRRGRWVGASYFTSYVAAVFANLLIVTMVFLAPDAYKDWMWRVPFILGGIFGVVGFWLRRRLEDPEEYLECKRETQVDNLMATAARSGFKGMIYVLLLMPIPAVGGYFILGFMYSFLVTHVKVAPTVALLTNAGAVMVYGLCVLYGGRLSDRLGRKKVMSFGAAWVAISAYPAILLASRGTIEGALVGQTLFAIGVGSFGGAALTAMLEVFPTAYRATGHALSYQLSVAILGGTTPFISSLLITKFGSPLAPGFLVAIVGAIALVAVQFVPETKGVRLRDSVGDEALNAGGTVSTKVI